MAMYRDQRTGRVVSLPFDPGGPWVAVPDRTDGGGIDGRDSAFGESGFDPDASPLEGYAGSGN